MDDMTISMLRYVLFVVVIFYVIRAFIPRHGLKNKSLYFEFCQLRRDLMHLVIADKINIKCMSFEFFIRSLSDIIHYSDDYRFGAKFFIQMIRRGSDDLSQKKFIDKLMNDIEKQDKEFQELFKKFFLLIVRAFEKNLIVWLILRVGFLYYLARQNKPKSSYTRVADAVKNIKEVCPACS